MTRYYQCPRCGSISYNRNDIEQGYCGNCKQFDDYVSSKYRQSIVHRVEKSVDRGVESVTGVLPPSTQSLMKKRIELVIRGLGLDLHKEGYREGYRMASMKTQEIMKQVKSGFDECEAALDYECEKGFYSKEVALRCKELLRETYERMERIVKENENEP